MNPTYVILASVISLVVLISVGVYTLSQIAHIVGQFAQERSIIKSVNEMNRFIPIALEQAAIYSAYQTSYDVSKYGTYQHGSYGIFGKCDITSVDSTLLNSIPKDLPYWRVFSAACFDAASVPSEMENTVIKPRLQTEISDKSNEYIAAIKTKYDISIPPYVPTVQILNGEAISLDFSTAPGNRVEFNSEKLKLSKEIKIKKEIKLPLKRLIDYSISKFITPADPFAEEIKKAEQAMGKVTVQNRISANPSSVKPAFANNNLNDGELTDREKRNCKSTEFKTCIDPRINPDFTYIYPTKSELLPTNCESEFQAKVTNNVNALNFNTATIDVSIKPSIKTSVDVNDEKTCPAVDPESNSKNSCDCIRWVCSQPNQVKVGDQERERPIGDFVVGTEAGKPNVECTTCFSIEGSNCVQYSDKVCPEGIPQNGFCKVEVNPSCDSGSYNSITNDCRSSAICSGVLNGATDMCEASPDCPIGGVYFPNENVCVLIANELAGCPVGFTQVGLCSGGECTCHTSDTCSTGILDGGIDKCLSSPRCPIGTGYDTVNDNCVRGAFCSRGFLDTATDRCVDFVGKQCPSGTSEYQGTGRCYNTPSASSEPVCNLHKTLYTKTCDYNYQAQVTTLINLKDKTKNKYPVYDSTEQKTDMRNLELQFYVLSKN